MARYGLSGWVQARAGFGFPWGTFAVNVLGSLLIGVTLRYVVAAGVTAETRALLTVGVLGAFTTFSAFTYETVALLEAGQWWRAASYTLGSLAVGIAAVYAGIALAGYLVEARIA
jgi:CrcB protein